MHRWIGRHTMSLRTSQHSTLPPTNTQAPRAAWEDVLPQVLSSLGGADESVLRMALRSSATGPHDAAAASSAVGGVSIRLQMSLGVPIQVEAAGAGGETAPQRAKLPARFSEAMSLLMAASSEDFFAGRKWLDRGVRYLDNDAEGQAAEQLITRVLAAEISEIDAAYPADRLAATVAAATGLTTSANIPTAMADTTAAVANAAASVALSLAQVEHLIEQVERGDLRGGVENTAAALQGLAGFVESGGGVVSARRTALAYLGSTGERGGDVTFKALAAAFRCETAAGMRRTAGDALSDFGDPRAVPLARAALLDSSKLVRWRASRILGELG